MGRAIRFRRYKQFGRYNTRYMRYLYDKQQKLVFPLPELPKILEEKGIRIEDPNNPDFPRITSKTPIQLNHPAWPRLDSVTTHPWYKSTVGYVFDGSQPLADGINQALAISKAVLREKLPSQPSNEWQQPKNCDSIVERLIMQSQRYDATRELLPKKRDPLIWWRAWPPLVGIPQERKNEVFLDNLLRFAQLYGAKQFPEVKTRRHVRLPILNATLQRSGNPICVSMTPNIAIAQPRPIKPFWDRSAVEATATERLIDISPISHTVDLKPEHIYNPTTVSPLSWAVPSQHIHTVFVSKVYDVYYPWANSEVSGNAIMAAFGAALASAKLKYPNATGTLPEPVVAQCVQCCLGTLDFVIFQLNTLNFNDDDGVKNIVFVDPANALFSTHEHWKPYDKLENYKPEIINKYMNLMSSGVST